MSDCDYRGFSNVHLAVILRAMAEADRRLHGAEEMKATIAVLEEAARRLEEVGKA